MTADHPVEAMRDAATAPVAFTGQPADSARADPYRRPAPATNVFDLPSRGRMAEYFRKQRPVW